MVTLWDVSSYVYADYVEKLGINYIDSIEGIIEKIQMKANRISHVFTVHMRIFLCFWTEATKQSSMHNFLPLAMCTIGSTQQHGYESLLPFPALLKQNPMTTLFTVKDYSTLL